MKKSYILVSDQEPTETDPKKLIHAVAVEAKQKAVVVNGKLRDSIQQATLAAIQKKRDENIK